MENLHVPVSILEDVPMEGGQCSLWPGALFMCQYLEKNPPHFFENTIKAFDSFNPFNNSTRRQATWPAVLELGAGCGILSMVYSLLLSSSIQQNYHNKYTKSNKMNKNDIKNKNNQNLNKMSLLNP